MANGKIRFGKQSGGQLALVFPDGVDNTEVIVPESGTLVSVDGGVTDNAIARYDGTTGKLQNSGVTIDDNSVLGIGAYYGGWQTGRKVLTVGDAGISCFPSGQQIIISSNMRYDGAYRFITNGNMGLYYQLSGQHIWSNSLGGVAGEPAAAIVEHLILDTSGNLLLKSGTGAIGYGAGAGGTVTQLTSKSTAVTLNKPSGRIDTHTGELAAGATVYFQLNNSLLSIGDGVIITNASYGAYAIRVGIVTNGSAYIYITNTQSTSQLQTIPIQFQVIKGSN